MNKTKKDPNSIFRGLFYFSNWNVKKTFQIAKLFTKDSCFKILHAPISEVFPEKTPAIGHVLIVISKAVGKAHDRNRLRRRIKAIYFEEKLYENPSVFVIIAYKNSLRLTHAQIKDFLCTNLKP